MNLSPTYKLLWFYILDKCDNVGVWSPNFRLAEFCVGVTGINWDDVLLKFGDRIAVVNGGKWWVHEFTNYQFGELKKDCRPHQSYLQLLRKHNLSIPYTKGINTLKEKDKEIDKDQDKEKEPTKIENPEKFTVEQFIKEYPKNSTPAIVRKEWKDLVTYSNDFEQVREMIKKQLPIFAEAMKAESRPASKITEAHNWLKSRMFERDWSQDLKAAKQTGIDPVQPKRAPKKTHYSAQELDYYRKMGKTPPPLN